MADTEKPKQDPFYMVPVAIVECLDIGPAAKMVYIVVADDIRQNGGTSQLGHRVIAGLACCGTNTATRALVKIETLGFLRVKHGADGHKNTYRLGKLPRPQNGGAPRMGTPQNGGATVPTVGAQPSPKWVQSTETEKRESLLRKDKAQASPKPDSWEFAEALLPEGSPLKSHRFKEAWEDWVGHRQEIRKKLTPRSVKKQIRECVEWGLEAAIATIDHTIKKGWQGMVNPQGKVASKPPSRGVNMPTQAEEDEYRADLLRHPETTDAMRASAMKKCQEAGLLAPDRKEGGA